MSPANLPYENHKNGFFSKSADAGILIFTFMKFAHRELSYFIETSDDNFFFTQFYLTGPVYCVRENFPIYLFFAFH